MKFYALLAAMALATARLVPTEDAEAFAGCPSEVINTGPTPCEGILCLGYRSGAGWLWCLSTDIYHCQQQPCPLP